jgi:CPA1 family monovalent cation:H+ antiporter
LIEILVKLASRLESVAIPVWLKKRKIRFEKNAIAILTWGGLKGGLSIALALSLSQNEYRDEFVVMTYIIVVFSILVQGLSIGRVTKKLMEKKV